MEIKSGYKQTEVGVIPEEWDVKPLWEISPKQSVGLVINPSTYFDRAGTVPLLVGSNVSENLIDATFANRITKTSNDTLTASRLSAGDLVTVRVGEPGVTAIVPPELDGCNCASMMIVRKHTSFDSNWLCAMMNSRLGRRQVESVQYGTAQKQFNISDAVDFIFAVPSLPEQGVIAEALSDVDGLVGGLDRLIAKKRDLRQAAMQQLLTGQTRLPGFDGEWEVKRLGDVGEISSAGVDKKIRPDEVPVRLVNYLDVYGKDFIYSDDLNHWVTAPVQQAKRGAVQKGDVFFTPTSETRDDIGISAVAMENIPDAAYSYHVVRLRLREPWDLCFRTYAFKTRAFLDQAEKLCDGNGTRYVISQGKFRSMTVEVPPIPEQTAIATVLTGIDAELALLEQRRAKTRALEQAMMQELLTGRIRLVSPPQATTEKPAHNWQINEAVIVGALALQFGTEAWPLPRKRRVKLTYLLHRHAEGKAEGYLKKAAGPYNPKTKYQGPEGIAIKNGYVREHNNGKYEGLIAGGKIAQAEQYFAEWYPGGREWVEQFRFRKTDELEVLATVDMAMEDLKSSDRAVNLDGVKEVIRAHPEWEAKLSRSAFSDANIADAMSNCNELFIKSTGI